ncbi:unnamed protein product [Closterium sp. NIES-53]
MATPRVLRFDVEGRPLEFSGGLLCARRLLESQRGIRVTLRPASACILPEFEESHFTQVRTASEFLTAIKARYTTPTTVSLGRLLLPFLFLDLALFECTADLITHLHSLDSNYRAACTGAQLALLPPPMAITIYFITTSLPGWHASLPTFIASLATGAIGVTAAAVKTSSRSRGRSDTRGGQGAGGGGGGGGGDVATGGGRSAGAGGAPRAAAGVSPAAAGGGDARVRQPPTGLPAAGGGAAALYLTHRQQQQQPLPLQQP